MICISRGTTTGVVSRIKKYLLSPSREKISHHLNSKVHTCPKYLSPLKEFAWCAPSGLPTRRQHSTNQPKTTKMEIFHDNNYQRYEQSISQNKSINHQHDNDTRDGDSNVNVDEHPIDRFGIVAAMSKDDGVIGMNGGIPWRRIAEDRKIFKHLTKNKILIIGKRTFEERPDLIHIKHSRHCIVVSKSMLSFSLSPSSSTNVVVATTTNNKNNSNSNDIMELHLVRSFPEALRLAKKLSTSNNNSKKDTVHIDDNSNNNNNRYSQEKEEKKIEPCNTLQCWVAGGEKIYEEALQHSSAAEIHLSVVNTAEEDMDRNNVETIARFPAKYRWDPQFRDVHQTIYPPQSAGDGNNGVPGFTYSIFRKQ